MHISRFSRYLRALFLISLAKDEFFRSKTSINCNRLHKIEILLFFS
jgi:hypothetical protein